MFRIGNPNGYEFDRIFESRGCKDEDKRFCRTLIKCSEWIALAALLYIGGIFFGIIKIRSSPCHWIWGFVFISLVYFVAPPGLEPGHSGPKPDVLPLHHGADCIGGRTWTSDFRFWRPVFCQLNYTYVYMVTFGKSTWIFPEEPSRLLQYQVR